MKKIFITGADGFLGSHLSRYLKKAGHDVIGYHADILDSKSLGAAIASYEFDFVIHLAGISSVTEAEQDQKKLHEVNVLGTYNLLEKMALTKHRPGHLIFASTAQVYSVEQTIVPIPETQIPQPSNAYARSKLGGEGLVREFSNSYNFGASIFRIFNHTHKSQPTNFFLPRIYQNCIDAKKSGNKEVEIQVGSVSGIRDISPVQNILEIMGSFITLKKHLPNSEIFNISSGQGFVLKDMALALAEEIGVKILLKEDPTKVRFNDPKFFIGDNSKIKSHLGVSASNENVTLQNLIKDFLRDIP